MLYELHLHDTSGRSGIQAAVVRSRTAFGPISAGDLVRGTSPLATALYTVARIEHSFPKTIATWELDDSPPIDDAELAYDPEEDPARQILVHRMDVYLAPGSASG
jgi:hypothetical protein